LDVLEGCTLTFRKITVIVKKLVRSNEVKTVEFLFSLFSESLVKSGVGYAVAEAVTGFLLQRHGFMLRAVHV
jgi:hypothetical protein